MLGVLSRESFRLLDMPAGSGDAFDLPQLDPISPFMMDNDAAPVRPVIPIATLDQPNRGSVS